MFVKVHGVYNCASCDCTPLVYCNTFQAASAVNAIIVHPPFPAGYMVNVSQKPELSVASAPVQAWESKRNCCKLICGTLR